MAAKVGGTETANAIQVFPNEPSIDGLQAILDGGWRFGGRDGNILQLDGSVVLILTKGKGQQAVFIDESEPDRGITRLKTALNKKAGNVIKHQIPIGSTKRFVLIVERGPTPK